MLAAGFFTGLISPPQLLFRRRAPIRRWKASSSVLPRACARESVDVRSLPSQLDRLALERRDI